jgi:lysophospholipase L1-like esterase
MPKNILPGSPSKKTPEKSPDRLALENKIKRTATERDRVTEILWSQLLVHQTNPEKFAHQACKIAKIPEPKPGEPLAITIFRLQRDALNFDLADRYDACDGKGGDITFTTLLKKFPILKKFSKEAREPITAKFRGKREEFRQSAGLPPAPSDDKERPPVNYRKLCAIGDSLSVGTGYGRSPFVKGGMSVTWMRRKVERNQNVLRRYKAFSLWAGANDVSYRSPHEIFRHTQAIVNVILKNNPTARIALVELPPMKGWKGFRNKAKKEKVDRTIRTYNKLLAQYARRFPQNLSLIRIYNSLNNPNRSGYQKIRSDGLHLNRKYYRAVKRSIGEDLSTGRHNNLDSYLA